MDSPLVSIVINYLNGSEFIEEALDSVIKQDYENWEIIFIDNGSVDNVFEQLKENHNLNSKLNYYKNQETVPLAEARNQAVKRSQGSFIAFLDCDDRWGATKLSKQLKAFNDDSIGAVYTNYRLFNNSGLEEIAYKQGGMPVGNLYNKLMFNDFICFSSLMIRSSIPNKSKIYFDPCLSYVEDEDLLIRIAREWNFNFIDEVLCDYRMHENSLTSKARLEVREEEEYLLKKYEENFEDFNSAKVGHFKKILLKNRAVTLWRLKNSAQARRLMMRVAFYNIHFFAIYLAMFLSPDIVDGFRDKVRKKIPTYKV